MGQKIHPGGLRVGIIHDWKSNWYSRKEFCALPDRGPPDPRRTSTASSRHAGLSDIHIRKDTQKITIDIYTARPGIVIGKSGVEVDALRERAARDDGKAVQININEIKRPELDAKLMAQSVAEQLQNRVSFRRAMKRSLASAMRSGAQGVKVQCGGRLGGTEMSRSEKYSEGRVPLHTLRADIDYGFAEAKTTYGRIGVKVWINKGEIMPEGYEGADGQTTRLGEVDARRRRGGAARGRRTSSGPARPQRRGRCGGPGGGGGRGRGPGGGGGGRVARAAVAAPGGGGGGGRGFGGPGGGRGARWLAAAGCPAGPSRARPVAGRARGPAARPQQRPSERRPAARGERPRPRRPAEHVGPVREGGES